jgi:hypothetical protein
MQNFSTHFFFLLINFRWISILPQVKNESFSEYSKAQDIIKHLNKL